MFLSEFSCRHGGKMKRDYLKEFNEFLEKEKTLAVMMLDRAEKFEKNNALRYMEEGSWHSITWKEFGESIRAVAKGLLEMNIEPADMNINRLYIGANASF